MAVFVVTWNINKERSNYNNARSEFIKQLEQYDNKADLGLESVRFISTTQTARQIEEFLHQKLDKNDRILVTKLKENEHYGWLSGSVADWISANL